MGGEVIPILSARRDWECPNCSLRDATFEAQPHTRYHNCAGLHGLSAPMVPVGTRCEVRAVVREDYVGTEDVTYDENGRPISAVETVREDGNDVAVYAPCVNSEMRLG